MKNLPIILLFFLISPVFAQIEGPINSNSTQECASCHGPQGNTPQAIWPNIAGQHASYLLKQLREMKANKTRAAGVMAPILAKLNDSDFTYFASYYAHLPLNEGMTPQRFLKKGQTLYRGGDQKLGITACIACHGPDGKGNGQAIFPALSGQNPLYTIAQLNAFKSKQRTNDLNQMMQSIAQNMTPQDIEAVAYYIAGLH